MRKTEIVRRTSGDRDDGKMFKITEWPAARAEKWAISMLLAYNRGGGEIPYQSLFGAGMEAIFILGVNTFLRGQIRSEEVVPLLDELLECVEMVRDPKAVGPGGELVATPLLEEDVQEVMTRMWLRSEVVRVHTGFSMADAVSTLLSRVLSTPAQNQDSSSTQTSPL